MRAKSLIVGLAVVAALVLSGCNNYEPDLNLFPGESRETNTEGVTYHRVEFQDEDGDLRTLDCLYFLGPYSGGPWCEDVNK